MSKLTLLVILAASAIALPAERKHQSEKLMVHDAKTQQVGLQQKNHETSTSKDLMEELLLQLTKTSRKQEKLAVTQHNECVLNRNVVNDIQRYTSGKQYIVINGSTNHVLIQTTSMVELFFDLSFLVSSSQGSTEITNIWFSHVPCPLCISYLILLLPPPMTLRSPRRMIHIENLVYPESSNNNKKRDKDKTDQILGALGCIEKLVSLGYNVTGWDWNTFAADTHGTSSSCTYYTSRYDSDDYANMKDIIGRYLNSQPNSGYFSPFCSLPTL